MDGIWMVYGWYRDVTPSKAAALCIPVLRPADYTGLHALLPVTCRCQCRMLYGFSRDRAVPFWWLWTKVDDQGVPTHAGSRAHRCM